MRVTISGSAIRHAKWSEFAVRFLFGGIATAITGMIAKKFGPGVGGLFLAFPAILPATIGLVEKHEREKKQKAGFEGSKRGRKAASVDAAGAAMGSIGLLVFAVLVWQFLPSCKSWMVLAGATIAWFAAALAIWRSRKTWRRLARSSRGPSRRKPS